MARRKRIWVRRSFLISTAADLIDPVYAVHPGVTVARIRLNFYNVSSTAGNAASTLGVLVRDTSSSGVTGPVTNPTADWMAYNTVTTDGFAMIQPAEWDVKSMRKMDELGSRLFLYSETPTSASAIGALGVTSSVLLLLP